MSVRKCETENGVLGREGEEGKLGRDWPQSLAQTLALQLVSIEAFWSYITAMFDLSGLFPLYYQYDWAGIDIGATFLP